MRVGYIVHNLNDPAVRRRCTMLERGGTSVALAGFCRNDQIEPEIDRLQPLLLGQSADAALLQRAGATAKAAIWHRALARQVAQCEVIVARNLEQLVVARAVVGDRPLVYECLDIHRTLVGEGAASRIVQKVEAMLLKRVDLLITSSPAFVRHHFARRELKAPMVVIENKFLVPEAASVSAAPPQPALPLRIGWFGMLRCKRTLEFLTEVVKGSGGRIEVLIAGKPSPAELPHLEEVVEATPGMHFNGPYRYEDLPRLYNSCHFAWSIDWFEEGLNSSWLLPNRLYEALLFGAIPIALQSVETGRWLESNGVGLLVSGADEARDKLMAIDTAELAAMQQKAQSLDTTKVIADERDCLALVDMLGRLERQ